MRAKTLKEGTVGLLALVGLGLLAGLTLWLNDSYFGRRSYQIVVEFDNADGVKAGSAVRYRGVPVGTVKEIQTESNFVAVRLDISEPDLKIPRNSTIEVEQSGFIGDASLSIAPIAPLAPGRPSAGPLEAQCDRSLILCNGSRTTGNPPISYSTLIRAVVKVGDAITSPEFGNKIDRSLATVTATAADIRKLSQDAASLTRSIEREVPSFGTLARAFERELPTFGQTARSLSRTSDKIGAITSPTAGSLARAADRAGTLAVDLSSLIATNRTTLSSTLSSMAQTSTTLRNTLSQLTPFSRSLGESQLIQNLDRLSSNAAEASGHFRDLTGALSEPKTLNQLRETLDAARQTFRNIQKISGDLDNLTGDATFRQNIKNIINGLGSLLGSTRELQEQLALASQLDRLQVAQAATVPTSVQPPDQPEKSRGRLRKSI